ncbi:MAG: arylsulfatase [Planctomycetes bacterium]|nr:arylsulfatase [Planctomycetota bacterium]
MIHSSTTRTQAVWITIVSALTAGISAYATDAPAEDKSTLPNIVIILADDFGYGSTNATGAPKTLVQTTNIDRLFSEGRRFTNAYSPSSVCSPTRYGLLTGRYCFRTSLKRGVLNPFAPLHIEPTQLNVAALLKQHGYETAAIGKWHLGYGDARSSDARTDYAAELSPGPLEIGFDYHFGVPSNHGDLTGVFVENRYAYGLRNGKVAPGGQVGRPADGDDRFQAAYTAADTEAKRRDGIEIDAPKRKNDRVMSVLTEKAVTWLEGRQSNQPFFLYYTPVAVHNPVTPDPSLKGSSAAGSYGDWIHELDRSVGAVLEALDRKGLADNTIVLFSSDNGGVFRPANKAIVQTAAYEAGLRVNGDLRGGKHTVFEGGFRVPYAIRWPGKIPAGTVSDHVVGLNDTLATIAQVVGTPLGQPSQQAQDSVSVLPAWTRDAATPTEPASNESRSPLIVHSADGVFAIRKGPWKWIEGIPDPSVTEDSRNRADNFKAQLYNLAEDPSETKDLSEQHPEIVAELKELLDRYRDGGYSRELPTLQDVERGRLAANPEARPKVIPPIPKTVEETPKAPWSIVRGTWEAKDGGLFGTPAGRQPAALSALAPSNELRIQFEAKIGNVERQTVRIDLEGNQSVRFDLTPKGLAIVRNDSDGPQGPDEPETWAQSEATVDIAEWQTVELILQGNRAQLRVGSQSLETKQELLAKGKNRVSFVFLGGTAGIRDVKIESL